LATTAFWTGDLVAFFVGFTYYSDYSSLDYFFATFFDRTGF